jgi:serine/threonine protein phosphatase 1
MNHYVIGDVHGHFDTLMELVSLLSHDARLVFVGDLIDRGAKSAEVVRFVRENNHLCVMGNHEEAMVTQGFVISRCFETGEDLPTHSMWFSNGGVWTLQSYGLVKLENGKPVKADDFTEALKQFKDDMKWMEKLPLYLELPFEHLSEKTVVISHAPIATVWAMRKIDSMYGTFARLATTCRRDPDSSDAPIFNIFGHTPMQNGPRVCEHFVNIDTGCYMREGGYNQLSAYCIETGEVISVKGN